MLGRDGTGALGCLLFIGLGALAIAACGFVLKEAIDLTVWLRDVLAWL